MNPSVYPLVSDCVSELINYNYNLNSFDEKDRLNELQRREANPYDFFKEVILSNPKQIAYFYQSIITLLSLQLYVITLYLTKIMTYKISNSNGDFGYKLFKAELDVLSKFLYTRIDPNVRLYLKKGVCKIHEDILAGFDTEYQPKDIGVNELLSAQLSVTGGIKIQLPIVKEFTIEKIHPLTNETYPIYIEGENPFNLNKAMNITKESISLARSLLYPNFDKTVKSLINGFMNKETPYIKNDTRITFIFDRLPINQKLLLNNDMSGIS
jgi:hypothetical protein